MTWLEDQHCRPHHGRGPGPVAGHRHDRRRLRQAIIAAAKSFTQFVPGHVHLKDLGGLVCDAIAAAGGVGREFNTLYSLPSRELIADAEYLPLRGQPA